MKLVMFVRTPNSDWDEVANEAFVEFDANFIDALEGARSLVQETRSRALTVSRTILNHVSLMYLAYWCSPGNRSKSGRPLYTASPHVNHALVDAVPKDNREESDEDELIVTAEGFHFQALYKGTGQAMVSSFVTWAEFEKYAAYYWQANPQVTT